LKRHTKNPRYYHHKDLSQLYLHVWETQIPFIFQLICGVLLASSTMKCNFLRIKGKILGSEKEDVGMDKSGKVYGQSLLEYALILILVAIIVIIVIYLFGPAIGNLYSNIIQSI
jgi:pilus assembly protein Flp/PilA